MDKLQAHYRQIADEEYPECEGCKRLWAALNSLLARLDGARAESIGGIDTHRSARYSQKEIRELRALREGE